MDIIDLIQLSILCISLPVALMLQNKTVRLFGKKAHPLGFAILYQIFILTLPGVLIIYSGENCIGSVACELISENVKLRVAISYIITVIWIYICHVNLSYLIFNRKDFDYFIPDSLSDKVFVNTCFIFVLFIAAFRFLTTANIPLILAATGDLLAAEQAKAEILRGKSGLNLPVLNFFLKYFPLYAFYVFCFAAYKRKISITNTIAFLLVTVFLILYDLQKGQIVVALLGLFWLYISYSGNLRIILLGAPLLFGLVTLLFYISFEFDGDISYLIDAVLNRLFVAQAEGMFLVYEFIVPSDRYAYWGIPFANLMGFIQVDPLSDVVSIAFPGASDSWVNSTSFLIGEAYAIFHNYSMFLVFLSIIINIIFLNLVIKYLFRNNQKLFFPAIFVMTYTIPFANNITDLLYGRFILGFLIFMFFIFAVYRFSLLINNLMTGFKSTVSK